VVCETLRITRVPPVVETWPEQCASRINKKPCADLSPVLGSDRDGVVLRALPGFLGRSRWTSTVTPNNRSWATPSKRSVFAVLAALANRW